MGVLVKIENDSNGQFLIQPENPKEAGEIEAIKATALALLPKLQVLWESDLVVFSEVTDIFQLSGHTISIPEKPSIFDKGTPVAVRLPRACGRPMDPRTLLAALRLLLCAPPEKVIAQEKEWRIDEYTKKLRGKSVKRELDKARNRAIRDSDMCVKRARESLEKYFNQHPDMQIPHGILQSVVREHIEST